MQNWNRLPRTLLVVFLLIILCAGMFAPRVEKAEAKPLGANATNAVISEFRTTGPSGGNDEFIELYNPTNLAIDITGWKINGSNNTGSTSTRLDIGSIIGTVILQPGQHYLAARSGVGNYTGTAIPDETYATGIVDNGGIALYEADGVTLVDAVGMSIGSAYKEPSDGSGILSPMTSTDGTNNKSYERNMGSCSDANNNAADFTLVNTSNPQNSSVSGVSCLYITNVNSPKLDGIYTFGEVIDIDVTFSNNVNVTGSPVLSLETGTTDRNAVYVQGSDGDTTLTFRYTVSNTDSSLDLDYISTTALSLNGGTITGAVGNALLDLPAPGVSGSLGFNNNIQIDAVGNPSIVSIKRQSPTTTITTSSSLTFRVVFSEVVKNVDLNDFVVTGLTTPSVAVSSIDGNTFDVNVTGGNIDMTNGVVGLDIALGVSIIDVALVGNPLPATPEPSIDETYTLDNTLPAIVSINQAATQTDPTAIQPVLFSIVFSEAIDNSTFAATDVTQIGTATGVTWYISSTADTKIFNLSATASGSGTLIPSIAADNLKDLAGNNNVAFADGNCGAIEPNNCVVLNVTIAPTVTVNQFSIQPDPTSALPINFIIQFSEPINTTVFTTADITQNGTATGVTWNITNSGDNMIFTLSATASGFGTLVPSIAANRVTDFAGNNNTVSTSTDNSVTYQINTATARSILISEVAWAGTTSSLTDDEWIELYNPGSAAINVTGWTLKAADSNPSITLNGTIPAGGYFLLERDNDGTVSDILADQIYTGDLSNSGEALTLRDGANNVIDTANGNGGVWPAGSSSTYGTMERVTTSSENDSSWRTNTGIKRNGKNANGGDILGTPKSSNSPLPTPTPTREIEKTDTPTPVPTYVPPDPRPIINEILPRPGFDWNQDDKVNVFDEFIEIKNLTSIDINLNGWKLDVLDGNTFTISDVPLKPGQRIVFYGLETNLLLSDGGATIRLINPNGKIYDAYTYTIARAEDRSICRLPDGNVYNGWFEDCIPTPNLSNSREGTVPSMSDEGYQSPVCQLPDTLPAAFLFAECHGYGARIWNADYWDQPDTSTSRYIPQNTSKWEAIIE